jgi:uncharacterized membrane protein YqaE (UPF0057 family)
MKRIFTRILWVVLSIAFLMPDAGAIVAPSRPATENPDAVTVNSAIESFKNLSKKERKAKMKEVKMAAKEFKAGKNSASAPTTNTLLLVLIAILLPPLAVYLHQGEINSKFWIALLLTLLFYVPGLVYALIVILGEKNY